LLTYPEADLQAYDVSSSIFKNEGFIVVLPMFLVDSVVTVICTCS